MGGLSIYSTSDVINYAFIASRLPTSSLQAKMLTNCDVSFPSPTFERVIGLFWFLCSSNVLFLNDEPHAPNFLLTIPIEGLRAENESSPVAIYFMLKTFYSFIHRK